MIIYKFTETDKPQPEVSIDELKRKYEIRGAFGIENLMNEGRYKLLGWAFDVREEFPKFLYKQYGQWHEAYAPNKTALRRAVYGRIERIINL